MWQISKVLFHSTVCVHEILPYIHVKTQISCFYSEFWTCSQSVMLLCYITFCRIRKDLWIWIHTNEFQTQPLTNLTLGCFLQSRIHSTGTAVSTRPSTLTYTLNTICRLLQLMSARKSKLRIRFLSTTSRTKASLLKDSSTPAASLHQQTSSCPC